MAGGLRQISLLLVNLVSDKTSHMTKPGMKRKPCPTLWEQTAEEQVTGELLEDEVSVDVAIVGAGSSHHLFSAPAFVALK